MDAEEARIYLYAWHKCLTDQQVAELTDDEAVTIAEQHWITTVGTNLPN